MKASKTIQVIPPGTPVTIAGDFKGTVNAVCINQGDVVEYKCAWWANGTRNCGWINSDEVSAVAQAPKKIIGFNHD